MKIIYKIILVFSLIILSILSYKISSKKIKGDISLPEPKLRYNFYHDIDYKNSSLKLDIYQPKNRTKGKSPVVIYVHGGAWDKGDKLLIKKNFRAYILQELLENEFTVISIDYTLLNKNTHLEKPLEDTKNAIKWISENAEQYNLDINNMGIWGGSAGAHIALLTAYNQKKTDTADTNHPYPKLKYVVDFYAPTNLNALFNTNANSLMLGIFKIYSPTSYKTRHEKMIQLTGFDIDTQKDQVIKKNSDYSPMTYVSKSTVPTLIFHGTEDSVVSITQSQQLEEALKSHKVPYKFYTVENAKHTFGNLNLSEAKDISKKTVDFIKSHTTYDY